MSRRIVTHQHLKQRKKIKIIRKSPTSKVLSILFYFSIYFSSFLFSHVTYTKSWICNLKILLMWNLMPNWFFFFFFPSILILWYLNYHKDYKMWWFIWICAVGVSVATENAKCRPIVCHSNQNISGNAY